MELVRRATAIGQGYWPAFGVFALGVCLLSTLLYVVAFLRTGLSEAFHQAETQKLRSEIVELTDKVKSYEGQLQVTLEGSAREVEKRAYEALLARTELIREIAKGDAKPARAQVVAVEKKEKSVQEYTELMSAWARTLKVGSQTWDSTLSLLLGPVVQWKSELAAIANEVGAVNRRIQETDKRFQREIAKAGQGKAQSLKAESTRQITSLQMKNQDRLKELNLLSAKIEERLKALPQGKE